MTGMSEAVVRLTTALADRYRLERELGQGGMATVYLALDLKHHGGVAPSPHPRAVRLGRGRSPAPRRGEGDRG